MFNILLFGGVKDIRLLILSVIIGYQPVANTLVADGKVFIGANDGLLYSVNIRSDLETWKVKTGGWVWSSPTIIND